MNIQKIRKKWTIVKSNNTHVRQMQRWPRCWDYHIQFKKKKKPNKYENEFLWKKQNNYIRYENFDKDMETTLKNKQKCFISNLKNSFNELNIRLDTIEERIIEEKVCKQK